MKRFLVLVVLALAALMAVDANADAPPERAVFALVVTSNKSQKLARPDLHYADDDGARYEALFSNLAPHADVTLLTTFDRDSAKLFPDLAAKATPPTVSNVRTAFVAIAKRVAEATARGARADFYFVFAGHGDVEEGRGFVELEDGRLVSDDLTSLLASVASTRTHVILDSCNSFFVINARKPGGHRFATGAEAGEKLNRSLPNAGVFLSTSAEAETFEWSELGAGIFSHAVRSGLSGAADANHDGEVSYEELAAFVATATKDVKNPRFRPNVFARGPSGKNGEAIASLANASAKLAIPKGAGRVTLRDADDLPWIDANFSASTTEPTLFVPARVAKGATLTYGGDRHALVVSSDGLSLAAGTSELVAARGAGDIFKTLFAQPFGPEELSRWKEEVANEPPAVYGVAGDDVVRMNELLRQAAESSRTDRRLQGLGLFGMATVYGGLGAVALVDKNRPLAASALSVGGGLAAISLWSFARESREEAAYQWFIDERTRHGATTDLMVGAEARLFDLARRDREERIFWRWFGLVYGSLITSAAVAGTIHALDDNILGYAYTWGAASVVSAVAFAIPIIGTFSPTHSERLAELWQRDPSRVRLDAAAPSFTIRPMVGAGSFGFGGTF
jgi:hypothetical protein